MSHRDQSTSRNRGGWMQLALHLCVLSGALRKVRPNLLLTPGHSRKEGCSDLAGRKSIKRMPIEEACILSVVVKVHFMSTSTFWLLVNSSWTECAMTSIEIAWDFIACYCMDSVMISSHCCAVSPLAGPPVSETRRPAGRSVYEMWESKLFARNHRVCNVDVLYLIIDIIHIQYIYVCI